MASHVIMSVPLDPKSSRSIEERLRTAMVETAGKDLCAYMVPFRVPQLRVGSLDTLMSLTDELARADAYNEAVLKKAERCVTESYIASNVARFLAEKPGADLASMPPLKPQNFYALGKLVHFPGPREARPKDEVTKGPATLFLEIFEWDSADWDPMEPLPSLIRRLMASAEKADQELRACSQAYVEKKTALVAAERKRTGNLVVCPLEDHITPRTLQAGNSEWLGSESEFLASVAVVIPATAEEQFLTTYHTLDSSAVPLGPEGRRDTQKGSPIVPRSARKISTDRDGYVLYTLVVLRAFLDSFRAAARERRWTVRDFTYVPSLAGSSAKACEELTKEVASALGILKDISRRRYEEAITRWVHVKMIRVHVDSVLRYGLPVNFTAVLFAPFKGEGARVLQACRAAWKTIAGAAGEFDAMYEPGGAAKGVKAGGGAAAGAGAGVGREEEEEEEEEAAPAGPDPVIPGVTDAVANGLPPLPFVYYEMDIRENTEASTAAASPGGGK